MAKIISRAKTNIIVHELNIRVKYRFINIQSLKTGESINIGMIWETENHTAPVIKLIDNLKFLHNFFPIFDVKHAEVCIKLIKIKYDLNEVNNREIKITPSVRISNVKIYKKTYADTLPNDIEIEQDLYNKYLTLQKAYSNFLHIHQNSLNDIIFNTKEVLKTLINISNKNQKSQPLELMSNDKIEEQFSNKPILKRLEELKRSKVKIHENT